MTAFKAIIVDDEQLARRGLEIRLAAYDDIDVVASVSNGSEALQAIGEQRPDLMFLDIQMPGLSGFDVVEQLQGDDAPQVIFVTAYDHFAIQAFDANALDYLLKPINDERLREAIERVRQVCRQRDAVGQRDRLLKLIASLKGNDLSVDEALAEMPAEQHYVERLAIRDGRTTACVDVDDIEWIDAARDYMCIHANQQTHILRGTMKKLEDSLDPERFVRIHRSTIVNRRRVVALTPHRNGEYFVRLDSDREFKLSRKYRCNLGRIAERL